MGLILGIIVLAIILKVGVSATSLALRIVLGVAGIFVALALIPAMIAFMLPLIFIGMGIAAIGLVFKAIF